MDNNLTHPKEWKTYKLSDIGKFSKGKSIAKGDIQEEGIPCIRYADIHTKYNYNVREIKHFISEEIAKESKKIKFNDLLFADSSETPTEAGKSIAYRLKGEAYACHHTIILSLPEDYRADYLAYYLNTISRKRISQIAEGHSMVSMYASYLGTIEIAIPNIEEQNKIVEILDTWERKIDATKQLLENRKNRFRTIQSALLCDTSQKFHWEKVSLGKIGYTYAGLSGKSKKDFGKGKPYIPYKNVRYNNKIDISNLEYVQIGENENQNKVAKDDVIFTMSTEVGISSVIIDDIEECYLNSFCFGWRQKEKIILTNYLKYYFRSNAFKKQITRISQKSTIDNLSKKHFLECYISYPEIKYQKRIVEILDALEEEINTLKKLTENYKEQQKSLMKKLLSGE